MSETITSSLSFKINYTDETKRNYLFDEIPSSALASIEDRIITINESQDSVKSTMEQVFVSNAGASFAFISDAIITSKCEEKLF